MMRATILIFSLIIAYVLLSGWPESLPMWMRACLALILVMMAVPLTDASSKSRNRPRLSSLRAPKWLDYLYIGAVIFCIELLLLAVFTLGPKTTEDIHEEVKYWLTSGKEATADTAITPDKLSHNGEGNWLWDNHYKRSHPKQTSKRPPNKPEIIMEVIDKLSQDSLQKRSIYLRTFALNHFDGDTWSINQPTKLIIDKPEDSNLQISPVNGTWRSRLPLYDHTITQPYYKNGQNLLTTLQHTIETDVKMLTKVSTDTFILPRLDENVTNFTYSATSQPVLLDEIVELDKNLTVGETHSIYLSRVSDPRLQSRLTDFVGDVDRTLPLEQQLSVLKKLINDQCRYSLTIENEGGINALENFLFEEKSGYCEFYASAAAMLCRELGIPSRIAFGWSGGKFYQSSDLFVFYSKDAHTWTEIYLDGYGWVIFDTTPPTTNAITKSQLGEVPPDLTATIGDLEDNLLNDFTDGNFISWMQVFMILGSLITFIIALLLLRRLTQPAQRNSSATYVTRDTRYIPLFQKLSATLGYPVKPGQTLMQSIQQLKSHDLDLSGLDTILDEVLSYHYNTVYRDSPITKAKEEQLTSRLKALLRAERLR